MWTGLRKRHLAIHLHIMLLCVLAKAVGQTTMSIETQVTNRHGQVKDALELVQLENRFNCTRGAGHKLDLVFNTSMWKAYTEPAIRTANFLSKFIADSNNLDALSKSTFYNFVRNNVHGNTMVYGSVIALESNVYNNLTYFAPYACKSEGRVQAFDLSRFYNYSTDNETEWYYDIQIKDFSNVTKVIDKIAFEGLNFSNTSSQPVVDYEDGRWTKPYFDCGGGDIWMVTYSVPILGIDQQNRSVVFKGVTTIDLELTRIDINQCDADNGSAQGSLDIFRGTHNCENTTTKCVPITGQGFTRGSYKCECLDGYYFPNTSAPKELRAFKGTDLDQAFTNVQDAKCLPCKRTCMTCEDDTPCLFENNRVVRYFVVFIISLLIICCCLLSYFTHKYRKTMVMKTASPIFLQIIIFGAVLMCLSVYILFPEPTQYLCIAFNWLFHLGFSILYSSLIIKTWRISVIFNSRKKVYLPDIVLFKRLLPLPAVFAIILTGWMFLTPPTVEIIVMETQKRFFICSLNYWDIGMYCAEGVVLLFGVYLCFTVRKAPAHFNESKHISWCTYNAIILGTFIMTLAYFLRDRSGPDVVYLLLMAKLHVFVTFAMALIFIPKFWHLYNSKSGDLETTVTGRSMAVGSSRSHTQIDTSSKSTQFPEDIEDFTSVVSKNSPRTLSLGRGHKRSNLTAGMYAAKVSPASVSPLSPKEDDPFPLLVPQMQPLET